MFSKFFKNNKSIVLGAVLLASALGTNYYAAGMEGDSDASNERKFLGTGTKVEIGPCIMGVQVVITTYTVLWIQIGEPTTQRLTC